MWLGPQVPGAAGLLGCYQPVSSQGAFSIHGDNHGDGEGLSSEVKGHPGSTLRQLLHLMGR